MDRGFDCRRHGLGAGGDGPSFLVRVRVVGAMVLGHLDRPQFSAPDRSLFLFARLARRAVFLGTPLGASPESDAMPVDRVGAGGKLGDLGELAVDHQTLPRSDDGGGVHR